MLLEVIQLRAAPGGGFDDWLAEQQHGTDELGIDELNLWPAASTGPSQLLESDRFGAPGAIVLESSREQAWYRSGGTVEPRAALPAEELADANDDIAQHVDALLHSLEADRLSYEQERKRETAASARVATERDDDMRFREAGRDAGYDEQEDDYDDETTPERHATRSPALRATNVGAKHGGGGGGARGQPFAPQTGVRLVRQTLTYRTSPPAARVAGARSARHGWDDSTGNPLDARADALRRREQSARHKALAMTAQVLEGRQGGNGLALLRAQLGELQAQLRGEAGDEQRTDAFFRAQLRRLHRLQAEAERLHAGAARAGGARALSAHDQLARSLLQEELEALLHDLDVDEPEAYARFDPRPVAPGARAPLSPRARATGAAPRAAVTWPRAPGTLVIVRKGGAGARQRAAASRKAGHADVPRPALASIVAPAEAASPPAQRAPPAPPAQAPRAQLAAQSDEVLRAIHAELGELKNGLGLQLGQQLQRVLDEIRAERREAREEEARRGADAAAAAAPSADARAHAFARAHGSPPPVQLPPSRLGSAPPSAYQSAANSLAPSPAPRATPQSAASAAESARGAARGGAREPSTAAGSRPHTSPLLGKASPTSPASSRLPASARGAGEQYLASVQSRRPSAQPSAPTEPTPALYTAEGSSAVAHMLELIDSAQRHEQQMAEKWREIWKEPLVRQSRLDSLSEAAHDDGAGWQASADEYAWQPQRASTASGASAHATTPRAFDRSPARYAAHASGSSAARDARALPVERRPLAELTVSAILDQAHQRELRIRCEADRLGGLETNLANLESAIAERLLDDVIREQAGALARASDSVVDRLYASEIGTP